MAIKMSNERIKELETKSREKIGACLFDKYRPIAKVRDARRSSEILSKLGFGKESIDLICAHPPYLNALRYTENVNGDLSHFSDPDLFLDEVQKVAKEIYMPLKKGGRCAVLIGDIRKNGKIIPLGFNLMERFLRENFELEEIIIKHQHKDESTEFYFGKKFLNYLIAHEYLFIFKKEGG